MEKENLNLDCWAIVELFGHQKIAGHVTTQLFGVAVMLRVDVPEFETVQRKYNYETSQYEEFIVKSPAYTRYFGAGAIYAINPSTEELVRKLLHKMDAPPDICLDIQRKALPAPADPVAQTSAPEVCGTSEPPLCPDCDMELVRGDDELAPTLLCKQCGWTGTPLDLDNAAKESGEPA